MNVSARSAVYATPAWEATPDGVCRPGGLALTDHALALCALPPGARALDVGCGSGAVGAHLRDRHGLTAFGLDLVLGALRRAAPGLPRLQALAETLPFPAASFDLVLAECSLSLLSEPGRAMAEFRRCLRPGGGLVVSDLYARSEAPSAPGAARLWTAAELRGLAAEAGFMLAAWEDHTPALKAFVAQWLFSHGTLPPLGCALDPAARPGYGLLIARRS